MDEITLMKMRNAWRTKARRDKTKIRTDFNVEFDLKGDRSVNHRLYQDTPKLEDTQAEWLKDRLGV